jgi:hypothetical protein
LHTRVELPDEVKKNMERGENFAILWNGLLVVAASFFLPAAAFFILLAIYCVAVAVYSVYREEIKKSLFNFFDKVASSFGIPTVEEVIEAEQRIQTPQQQQGMDYAAIHLLFANANPMFLVGGNQHQDVFVLDEETTDDEQEELLEPVAAPIWNGDIVRMSLRGG